MPAMLAHRVGHEWLLLWTVFQYLDGSENEVLGFPMTEDLFADIDLPPEMVAIIGVFALFRQMESHLDDLNISPPLSKQERRIMVFIDRPKRMGALAKDTATLPSSMTSMADNLESRGLVCRTRDPEDRRAWLLGLTDKGQAAREELMRKAAEKFRMISGMTGDEIQTFSQLAIKAMPLAMQSVCTEEDEQ